MFRRIRFPKGILILSGIGTSIGFLVLTKDVIGGDDYDGDEKMTGKTIIVTGANTGMGKALTHELANKGGRVIMACRNMEKCEAARKEIIEATYNRNLECKKLNLASLKSVREFAEDIKANEPRLDVLVNNAGVMSPPYEVTEDGFELTLATNFLGPFLLTNLLLDKLKECKPSRIINVSSMVYSKGQMAFSDLNSTRYYRGDIAYHQTKLANFLFNLELHKRLEGSGVDSFLSMPNITYTDLGRHMSMNNSFTRFIISPLWWLVMLTPRQGAQTTLMCILDPYLKPKRGHYYRLLEEKYPEYKARNAENAHRLWLIAEKWTRIDSQNSS